MNELPQWAIDKIISVYDENGREWKRTRRRLSVLWKKLGWQPSVQEIYNAINGLSDDDIQAPCGKPKRFDSFSDGYRFCGKPASCVCAKQQATQKVTATKRELWSDPTYREEIETKRRATMLDRHGVVSTMHSPELREKVQKTNRERYGSDNAMHSAVVREKVKTTMLERHGVENPSHSPKIVEKRTQTNMQRYGGASPLVAPDVQEKSKQALLDRYGVDHAAKSPEVKEQIKQTVQERYGVDYLQQSAEFRDKSRYTMVERYGAEHPLQVEDFRKKREETNLERYGASHAVQNDGIKQKIKDSNIKRYGVPVSSQSEEVKRRAVQTNMERYGVPATAQRTLTPESLVVLGDGALLEKMLETKSAQQIANDLSVHLTTVCRAFARHGIDLPRSTYEGEIMTFLKTLLDGWIGNTKSVIKSNGKIAELDFFHNDLSIAIEFNGLYHHSSIFKDKFYHRRKYEACAEKGIRLFMIDQDEWDERSSIIKKKISHHLGFGERGKAARSLKIKSISASEANDFFDAHHIQGKTGSIQFAIGAFENDVLVGAMAFNQQRGTQAVELIRFCSDGKIRAGLFSRLFKNALKIKNYREVISFADLRYSDGGVYRKNGFTLVKEVPPDYRYVIGNKKSHKTNFTKTRIAKKYPYLSHLTEREAMAELGYPRIYDCGKLKFVWRA